MGLRIFLSKKAVKVAYLGKKLYYQGGERMRMITMHENCNVI